MHVLITDDEAGTRQLIAAAVRRLGHHATTVGDGTAAWERFDAEAPDVLITDWEMPGLDGTELTARIRADGRRAYTYVLVLTGRADQDSAREAMYAGADELMHKPLDLADLERRLIAAERVVELHRRLADDARQDFLTGLGNRRRFDEDLAAGVARAERYDHGFALAIFDVDHFKAFNDGAGHLAGDDALRRVAATLRGLMRSGDSLYRYGGEEFVVLLPEQSAEGARLAAERLRAGVQRLALLHPAGGLVTVSAGVAVACAPTIDGAGLLAAGDAALYRAKAEGRNRVVVDPLGASPSSPVSLVGA